MNADHLPAAVSRLRAAGAVAGIGAADVDQEAAAFAATISVEASGAADEWATAFGQSASAHAAAASRGRSFRAAPTPILRRLVRDDPAAAREYAEALADVASAAYDLGAPSLSALGIAGTAAAAQLRVVGGPAPLLDPAPAAARASTSTSATTTTATAAATAGVAESAPEPSLDELLAELDGLIGLDTVKTEVHRQAELLRIEGKRAAKGLKNPDVTRHLVFVGNPGTGKSTVARLVGGIYRALGLLTAGHIVETDRSGLVGGYLGQTAEKTAAVLGKAYGGLLFIDEAYALVGDQYGDEAIATLVKAMEDHRDELVVIVAGYPAPMQRLIASNPGLASRFRLTIDFPDYTDGELVAIFERQCRSSDFTPSEPCVAGMRAVLANTPRGEGFGNARFVRSVFEAAVIRQAWRLRDVADPSVEQLRELQPADLVDADAVQPPSS
jgi:Holliday junction resolvasome RuvABC ATP-dependent DNA helicase subunit